ncbi:MAG: apolipoprotein N-acyltransferase [Pleurocapsa sp.]
MKLKINPIFIALASGILMGLAPAPFNCWYFAWIALAPLWVLIKQEKSTKKIVLIASAWGWGYHGLTLFWITGVHPMTWMGVPWLASLVIAILCWIFITFWGVVLVTLWALLLNLIGKKIIYKNVSKFLIIVIIGVAIWCSLESLWSHSPLWWSSLSITQSPSNLIILQLGKISGFNTITAAIVAVNGLLAEAFLSRQYLVRLSNKILSWSLPVTIFVICHLLGYWLYTIPNQVNDRNPIKVGIIQGNVPNEIKLYSAGWQKAIQGYTTGYQRLVKQGVDVVLTPETALPFYWENILDDSSFYQAVIKAKVPAWVGAFGKQNHSFTNSLFTLTGEGKTYSRYNKYKLVPLGEYIPFESILGQLIDRLSPLDAHLVAGKSDQIFDTPFGKAIVGICYESAFSQHFRRQAKEGGEFIITASNNAHYSTSMPAQHHAQDVMRAIESDRWAARATNTGYSAIVDPHGNTLWISEIEQYAIHAGAIYLRSNQTLYVRWGDWLTPALLLLSVLSFGIQSTTKYW